MVLIGMAGTSIYQGVRSIYGFSRALSYSGSSVDMGEILDWEANTVPVWQHRDNLYCPTWSFEMSSDHEANENIDLDSSSK